MGSCSDGSKGNGSIVTDCLPSGIITTVVRVALSCSLVVGYPAILFPVTEVLEEALLSSGWVTIQGKGRLSTCAQNMLRLSEVTFTVLVAISFGGDFSVFSGIVGAILIPMAGFILPGVMYLKTRANELKHLECVAVAANNEHQVEHSFSKQAPSWCEETMRYCHAVGLVIGGTGILCIGIYSLIAY